MTSPEASQVLDEIRGLLKDLGLPTVDSARLDSDLTGDLGLDSLSLVELLDRLEDRFAVTLPGSVLEAATTPRDWWRAVLDADRPGRSSTRDVEPPDTVPSPGQVPNVGVWPEDARTLTDALAFHADAHPDRLTLRILAGGGGPPADDLTYGALQTASRRAATGLLARRVQPGDRVALMLPTGRDYFIAFLAVQLAGGVPVPLYPPARRSAVAEHLDRQARILDNAGAVLLVTVDAARRAGRLLRARVGPLRGVVTVDDLLTEAPPVPLPPAGGDDAALIQYTSGSTGDPKGVVLTHAQLLADITAMGRAADVTPSDVFVSWLPLYHDMGLIGAWLAPMVLGFPSVIMSPLDFLAHPVAWLQALSAYRGTLSAAPNFAYRACTERISERDLPDLDLSNWRIAFNGSEPVSATDVEAFTDRFTACGFSPRAMCPAYGLAEAGLGVAFSPVGRGPQIDIVSRTGLQTTGQAVAAGADDPDALRLVSCGQALPGLEIRVADPAGRAQPERVEGAVLCRGPSLTSGYFANPTADADLWRGGWLDTGDLGYLADGHLFLSGRSKDLIIRAGRNLHPEDIEDAVGRIDGVTNHGVVAFATTGGNAPTDRLVVAVETAATGNARDRLRASIATAAGRVGATPDDIVLVPPNALSRTASGKIQRRATSLAYRSGALSRPRSPTLQLGRLIAAAAGSAVRRSFGLVPDLGFAAWTWALIVIVGGPSWLAVHLPLPLRARQAMTRQAIRALAAATGIGIDVHGALPPGDGPAIVVANHPSFIDGAVLLAALPPPVTFVSSTDIEHQPILGGFLGRIGCVFVDRQRAARSTQAVADLVSLVQAGHRLVMFPEGSLQPNDRTGPFRLGAFAVAASTGYPVVPVAIRGSPKVLPAGRHLPRRAPITVTIGSPIIRPGTGFDTAVRLRDDTHLAIEAMLLDPPADPTNAA